MNNGKAPERRPIKNVSRTDSKKEEKARFVMTPAKYGLIAALVAIVISVPLIIIALSRTTSEKLNITSAELGYNVITPEVSELEITEKMLEASPEVQENPDVLYKKGDKSEDIKLIQTRLMSLGYMVTDTPTDLFGPATEDAVSLFQTRHGLAITGEIDSATNDMLFSDDAEYFNLKVGSSGSDVAQVQTYLSKLGYLESSSTGYFGTETETAVRLFQKNNGLAVDGQIGINTLRVLKSSEAIKYVKPTPSPSPAAEAQPAE